ncbi:MAG TPA: peptide ABC transporter substrate-binding protein, partial [Myxococcaceae bacterium]|nr:peptide ABC transporter substrate-binding protein [Myxococcaceae bacterium]
MTRRLLLWVTVFVPLIASAASRPRYGGILRVASATAPQGADPLLADAPAEAALLGLTTRGVCRLDRNGRVVPELALSLERPLPSQVRVTLLPGLRTASGEAVGAQELAQSWGRLSQPASASPYRALLYPLKGEGRALSAAVTSQYALDMGLAFPWPDLEKSLCHPALAPLAGGNPKLSNGIGPFLATRAGGPFTFNVNAPEGRPFVDRLALAATDEHGATRAFAELHQAEVALGTSGGAPAGPLLYATYLAFRPERAPATFRQSVESAIDRSDLTRFFVRGPAAPLSQLLPPALMPNEPVAPPARPASVPQEMTLLYDTALPDQKWVAERIQVRLHDLGYRIQLRSMARASLRAAWASGDFD